MVSVHKIKNIIQLEKYMYHPEIRKQKQQQTQDLLLILDRTISLSCSSIFSSASLPYSDVKCIANSSTSATDEISPCSKSLNFCTSTADFRE